MPMPWQQPKKASSSTKKKKIQRPKHFDQHPSGFIFPPDPFFRMRRRVPKATVALYDQSGSTVDRVDEFGEEPPRTKLLPAYYYESEEEEDPVARRFPRLGKSNKVKRPAKAVPKVEEPKIVKHRSVRFAAPENNFEILVSDPKPPPSN